MLKHCTHNTQSSLLFHCSLENSNECSRRHSHCNTIILLVTSLHSVVHDGTKQSLNFLKFISLKKKENKVSCMQKEDNLFDGSTLQIQYYVIYVWCIGLHMLYMLNAGPPLSSSDVS